MLGVDGLGFAAAAAFLLIQLQILLDCSDGEVARWQQRFSAKGIYLDRIGHYVTEAGAADRARHRADEVTLGLVVAVLGAPDQVRDGARARRARGVGEAAAGRTARRSRRRAAGCCGSVRRALRAVPFYRAFVAMEFTLLALVARKLLDETDTLLVVLVPVAAITALGHLVAILTSDRLR